MQLDPHAIKIYTDGSCYSNPAGVAGAAAVVVYRDHMNREPEEIVDFGGHLRVSYDGSVYMRDQIIEKLRSTLDGGVDSECKVVYVLAECRKLLEKYPPDPVPFALKMYCHWALHVDLTNPGTTFRFLQNVDRFAESVLSGNTDVSGEHRMFREFVFLDTFRQQFREFLETYGLPAAVCNRDEHWHEFMKHYGAVIEDGSLACEARSQRLMVVSRVIISKANPRPKPSETVAFFDLSWEIILQDGGSMVVDVYAAPLPDGNQMFVHGIQLRGRPTLGQPA